MLVCSMMSRTRVCRAQAQRLGCLHLPKLALLSCLTELVTTISSAHIRSAPLPRYAGCWTPSYVWLS